MTSSADPMDGSFHDDSERSSLAALEVIQALSTLSVALAHVTRQPEIARPLLDSIGCRAIELLEVYVRRVVESIIGCDPDVWARVSTFRVTIAEALSLTREELIERMRQEDAPRVSGDFEKTQKLLGRFLRAEPFTADQIVHLRQLKEVRNLLVHNNGVADLAFVQKFPDVQVGDRVDFQVGALNCVLAAFTSVKHIDALLLRQYPDLGQVSGASVVGPLGAQVEQAFTVMQATPEELRRVQEVMDALGRAELPFPLDAVTPALPLPGLGALWLFSQGEGGWQAYGLDGRLALPFASEVLAREWVQRPGVDWTGSTLDGEEGEWVSLRFEDGLIVKWPRAEWSPA